MLAHRIPGDLSRIVPRQGNDCASAAKSQPHGAIVRSTTGLVGKTLTPFGVGFSKVLFLSGVLILGLFFGG